MWEVASNSQVRANSAATLTCEVVMRNHPIVSQQAWLGMIVAMAVTILAILTWTRRDLAAPIPPTEAIYQPQHLNLY